MMDLGKLIKLLELEDPEHSVRFDFVYTRPTKLHSYRGYYDQLALGWCDDGEIIRVKEILEDCRDAVGKIFTGWKGGEYRMDETTKVWVANPSESGATLIAGVIDNGYQTMITTRQSDDW